MVGAQVCIIRENVCPISYVIWFSPYAPTWGKKYLFIYYFLDYWFLFIYYFFDY